MSKRSQVSKAQALLKLASVLAEVRAEIERAIEKHGGVASAHEAHSVIREELDELWDEVKADRGYQDSARIEAIQIACTAVKYVLFLFDK